MCSPAWTVRLDSYFVCLAMINWLILMLIDEDVGGFIM